MDFGIAGVAAITVIAYAAGQAMKAWGRGERWIPTVCAVLGGILGVVGLYVMPGFPANDVITAAAIGMVSGLAGHRRAPGGEAAVHRAGLRKNALAHYRTGRPRLPPSGKKPKNFEKKC